MSKHYGHWEERWYCFSCDGRVSGVPEGVCPHCGAHFYSYSLLNARPVSKVQRLVETSEVVWWKPSTWFPKVELETKGKEA